MKHNHRHAQHGLAVISARPRTTVSAIVLAAMLLALVVLPPTLGGVPSFTPDVHAAGSLNVRIIAGYNLVVDSNAGSPSSYAPSVATVAIEFCNTGDAALTSVFGYIGNYTSTASSAPGVYPSRNSALFAPTDPLYNTGSYYFTHVGGQLGLRDATRYVGSLAPGQCKYQYWHFTYPQCSEPDRTIPCSGTPVWGTSVKPDDDLWLQFDAWGTSAEGSNDNDTWTMTMRNEISAVANKIKPNPDGRWFNTKADTVEAGELITSNGILYELGNINQGFDNDGDYVPDYNAWMQPIGDRSYDPGCFRLVRTSGVLTITRGAGNPDVVLPFDEQLYFMNLPTDNTGVRGEIFYTFMAMGGPCSVGLSPYQEVASGYDNEKFNGDYGVGIPPLGSYAPDVTLDKSSSPNRIPLGGTTTYRMPFANVGSGDAGLGLSTGGTTPVVVSDTVPSGMQYVGGSATYSLAFTPNTGVTRLYSTDSGRTWSQTDPGTVLSTWPNNKVILQWWLNDTLPAGSTGNYVQYQATVPASYSGSPFIENCADASFGAGVPFARACALIMVQGNNSLGDWVWRDEDSDALQDVGEIGINAIAVSLYWDKNGDRKLDSGDVLLSSMDTYTGLGRSGYYTFTNLPDANFLAVVDSKDANLPVGYGLTTPKVQPVALDPGGTNPQPVLYRDADFGFGPALKVVKRLTSENPSYEGDLVIYRIALVNNRPGDGSGRPAACTYTVWSTTRDPDHSGQNGSELWRNEPGAFGAGGPDYASAWSDYTNALNRLSGMDYNLGAQAGNITRVEALFSIYVDGTLTNDHAHSFLWFNNTLIASRNDPTPITPAELNAFGPTPSKQGLLTWNVTSARTWAWADFRGDLDLELDTHKEGGKDGGVVHLDAIGFRVTTDQQCGDPQDTIDPLPLTDTFDPAKVQFLSASPVQSSVAGGTITWNNLGPLYAGQTKEVTVVFKALQPPSNQPTTHQNCGNVTGATFLDGRPVNDASSCVNHTINPTANIGDTVWNDNGRGGGIPANGVQDGTEQGIANVTVYLCAGSVSICNSTTATKTTRTDALGKYLFEGVRDGTFTVAVDTATLPPGSTPTYDWDDGTKAPNNRSVTTIANAVDDLRQDFGYRFPNAIYGNVWDDANGDSNKQAGDNGIQGVTVYLCQTTPCTSLNAIRSTTTDANGNYLFGTLNDGTYYVGIGNTLGPLGADWTNTRDPEGAPGNHQSAAIAASGGNMFGSYDFGYYRAGNFRVGDTVYVDWNGDATQQTTEEGIPNITVYLYQDENGNGVVDPLTDGLVAVTVTNASGKYYFPNRGAGNYIVVVDKNDADFPSGYRQTQDPDEVGVCTTCNNQGNATLGPDKLTVDFGYQPRGAGSIGDFVWRDLDHDGVQDGGSETGIANITVRLYEDSNANGVIDSNDAVVATTSTDASGKYLFTYLPAGRFLVQVDTADSDLPVDGYGNRYTLSTNNDPLLVTLAAGEEYLDADFGFCAPGVIGDFIWQDNNGDGQQDIGEPGIANVTVYLCSALPCTGGNRLQTTTTDANGYYLFSGLPAGDYTVLVDTASPALSGFAQTGDPDLSMPCSGPTCDSLSSLHLSLGQVDRSRDFGYRPPALIGDTVWVDADRDGVQDLGESGIPYVTVRLYSNGPDGLPNTGDDLLVQTTATDSNGKYAFGGNFADGGYNVRVDRSDLDWPSGVVQTYDPDESNPCTTCDSIGLVTLSPSNRTVLTVDFGYYYYGPNSVSGTVYYDADDDAVQDPAETTTYPGVTIYLYDQNHRLIGTTVTDAYGNYTFGSLPDGNYTVSVNANAPNLYGLSPTATSSPTTYRAVALDPSETNPNPVNAVDQDFGFLSAVDAGDLPDSYGTTLASDGARHRVIRGTGMLILGQTIDIDPNGQASADARGDDTSGLADEDGIVLAPNTTWAPGSSAVLTATISGTSGYLVGFFDWNGDGHFDITETVDLGLVSDGFNPRTVAVPASAEPGAYMNVRFRLYAGLPAVISPKGLAIGGEVEDYQWPIGPTAVRLLYFTAGGEAVRVVLVWETASEDGNMGFNLYRRVVGTDTYLRVNDLLIPTRAGPGQGAVYAFTDEAVQAGLTYEFILEDVDANGTRTQHGPVAVTVPFGAFLPLVLK